MYKWGSENWYNHLPYEKARKSQVLHTVWCNTVEPRYVKLGYLELPAISNCFSLPFAQIHPGYLEFYYVPKKHWSKSVRKCSKAGHLMTRCTESWELYIDVFTVMKAKSDWLDLPLRIQKATSCRYLLILGIKPLLQKFDANLAISNPRYLELFLETLESSR